MGDLGVIAKVVAVVVGIPALAWLGATVTGPRGMLRGFVDRRYQVLVAVIVLGNIGINEYGKTTDAMWVTVVRTVMFVLAVMMFMPVVRRLRSFSSRRGE